MRPSWYEDFLWWKIGALTHDPPHKAWIMVPGLLRNKWKTGLGEEGVKAAENRDIKKSHECASFAIRANIFSEDIADFLSGYPRKKNQTKEISEEIRRRAKIAQSVIKEADKLASAFDRWQISRLHELWDQIFNVKKIYLFNLLSGDLIKSEVPGNVDITKFERVLRNIWRVTNNLSLRYHLFYALYEPMFYEKVAGLPSPADRRTPTHTVFDHLYACATIVNWLCSDAIASREELSPRGLLVRIDLAGIQDFISASRKLRDAWFSSWLASALIFKTIEELVKHIGPDILIRPTARHNPFYYNLLLQWLKGENVPKEVQKELKEIAEKYAGLEKWPKYAIIPATVDLLLPPYDVLSQLLGLQIRNNEDFIRYLHEKYTNCWKKIVEEVLRGMKRLERLGGKIREEMEKAAKKLREYGIEENPPLIMRVVIVSVPEDLSPEERKQKRLYYDYAFRKLNENFKSLKLFKIHPACLTNLTKVTEEMWRNKERYYVCTICGKLPSVLDIPYEEKDYFETVPSNLWIYFDPGEHLCPYCLIKRLATHRAIFSSIAKELIGCPVSPLSFPSTSSIATYPFMRGLVEAQDDENVKGMINEIIKRLKKLRLHPLIPYWKALEKLQKDARNEVKEFLSYDTELTLLPEEAEARRKAEKLREAVENSVQDILGRAFTRINTYYAIVRADGDYTGRLFVGELNQDTIGVDYIELLTSSMENIPDPEAIKFAKLIRESANNNVPTVRRILRSELRRKKDEVPEEKIRKASDELCELFSRIRKEGRIPVTPAYHATLSRALMITALKDIKTVQEEAKGVVIYASGDDFLAFVPVVFALDLVFRTRRYYSIGDLEHRGFHRVGNGYFMSLGRASRTYSVIFGHFKYPMSQLLRLSYEFLKESAKKAQVIRRTFRRTKDVLLLAYCPRGGGVKVKSILPLSGEGPIKLLISLVDGIENNLLSHSTVYDLIREVKRYGRETQQLGTFEIVENILNYLLNRNLIVKGARSTTRLIASKLKELADYTILDSEGNEETLSSYVVLALWATLAALRGREL